MKHNHVLYDSDPHFTIDPISRKITNESSRKTNIIQHDHNSERFTFECPRYIEGMDLSTCNIVEIHYLNVEANTKTVRAGVYTVKDLQVKPDDENSVVFSWIVGNNATQFVGRLQFLARFACALEDTGKVDYAWNTAIYDSIGVAQGIYNTDSPSDNPLPAFNFVTTINGQTLKFFVGTKEEYNQLTFEERQGVFALITDDTTKSDMLAAIDDVNDKVDELNEKVDAMVDAERDAMVDETVKYVQGVQDGDEIVPKATQAYYTPDGHSLNELAKNVDEFDKRIDDVEAILKAPIKLTKSDDGKLYLVEHGYYYIELAITEGGYMSRWSAGLVYFTGRTATVRVSNHNRDFDFSIASGTGEITVQERGSNDSWSNVTDKFDIYVNKLGVV